MTATYELILWPNCHNNCKFCFQKEQLRCGKLKSFSIDEMNCSIFATMLYLSRDLPKGSNVMIVGGELFDEPRIQPDIKELFSVIAELMEINIIKELYLNTNLIYKNIDPVMRVLDYFQRSNILERVHFTTSYDFDGRFTQATHNLMLKNLESVRTAFPKCRIYINTMLSKTACENIILNKFSVKDFSNKYQCYVNLIPYIELIPDITAERSQIVKALQTVDAEIPGYVSDYLLRLDINQEKYVLQYEPQKGRFIDRSCAVSFCGHAVNFTRYSSNKSCYICDMKHAFGL